MDGGDRIWGGDWRAKILGRVRSEGVGSISEFLGRHPCEPYHKAARRLGDDVAAVQLAQMQFEEATGPDDLRRAAMDGFAREIVEHLKRGWGVGRHADFNTAGAYAGWRALLQYRAQASPYLLSRGEAVWHELKRLDPPRGWLPAGSNDPILVSAFAEGWPPRNADVPSMVAANTDR